MNFDPIYDYGNTDLTKDDNLVCWKFGELIKNLITLSSSGERQTEIIGIGATCDEMVIDFDTYFTLSFQNYLDSQLLTHDQIRKLKELDVFLDERTPANSPDFWDDILLETNPEWEIVRKKAVDILRSLGMQDLTLEFDRQVQCETFEKRQRRSMQSTKSRLVRKNASKQSI